MFVTSFSSIQSAPASQVFKISHKDATAEGVVLATAGWVVEPRRKWLATHANSAPDPNTFFPMQPWTKTTNLQSCSVT